MENYLLQVKKSVTFIFAPDGPGNFRVLGTGFFVGVKNKENPDLAQIYLVTAKHVLQDQKGKYLPDIVIRLNLLEKDAQLIPIHLKDVKILEHDDPDVDLAVFPCLPDAKIYDFKFLLDDMISNQELITAHHIAEGDEVFFAGLFMSHIGQRRNQPVLRFGKVALMSEEKIEWKEGAHPAKLVDLYLLECQSMTGSSGSPVFFKLKDGKVLLAGVMKGSFFQGNEIQQSPNNKFVLWQNAGIAAVIPAEKLRDIFQPIGATFH